MSHPSLSEQELIRREKLKSLRELGINAYPAAAYPVNTYAALLNRTIQKKKRKNLNLYAWQAGS